MTQLNLAKELAIKYQENQALVKIVTASMTEIIKDNNKEIIKQQEYSKQVKSVFSRVNRRHTSKYKSIKNTTKILGFLTGILTLISTKIIPILPDFFGENRNSTLTSIFAIMAALSGLFYLMFSFITDRIKDSLDDLKDLLNDKSEYLKLINNILDNSEIRNYCFEKNKFRSVISDWFKQNKPRSRLQEVLNDFPIQNTSIIKIARRIGESDFTKLILAKGLENGYFIESEKIINGRPTILYSIKKVFNSSK